MVKLSGIFHVFLLALVFAMATNGVVMASNDVMHQKNCVHAPADEAQQIHVHQGHDGHHDAESDTIAAHDHNTCMMHACSAVAYEGHGLIVRPIALSMALTATERELIPLGLACDFLRPPNA